MTRLEYMNQLKDALKGFDTEIQEEIISDYEEHFAMGANSGKSEEELAAELGSIDELVEELNSLAGDKKTEKKAEESNTKSVFDDIDPNKAIDEVVKGFAGLLGSMAAGLTKGAEKLSNEINDAAEKGKEVVEAERTIRNFAKEINNVADKMVKGSSKVADKVVKGADKAFEKSASFMKDMSETVKAKADEAASVSGFDGKPEETEKDDAGKVTETYACKDDVHKVVVETDCGNVLIKKSDDNGFKFDYKNDGSVNQQLAYKFNWYQEGDVIKVSCLKKVGKSAFFSGLTCPDILITVSIPDDLDRLDIHTVSGDIKLDDVTVSTLKVNTMSGEVTFANSDAGNISAGTVSGDITVLNTNTSVAELKTVSGDLTYEGNAATVTAGSTSGDLDIKARGTREVTLNTVSGDTNIYLLNASGYHANVKTVSGDLSLKCGDESCKYIRSGSYTLGDGSCLVNVNSVSGDIAVYA